MKINILAKTAVLNLNDYAVNLIYEGKFTKKMLQYCNRYRSQQPDIHEVLFQAEVAFRAYHYVKARELVENLLRRLEPEAIGKIKQSIVVEDVVKTANLDSDIHKVETPISE